MKHLVYDKNTHKIISVLHCNEHTAMLQESEEHGVLIDPEMPVGLVDFSAYEERDGLLVSKAE